MSKKHRKFLATSVTAAIVASAIAPIGAAAATGFSDLKEGDFGYNEVMDLVELDLIKGYPDGTFKPNAEINRSQVAVLLARAWDLELPSDAETAAILKESYTDVTADTLYAKEIAAVTEAGLMQGNTVAKTFSPKATLKREQMATVLVRAYGLENTGEKTNLTDLAAVSADHRENVEILTQHGIANNEDGTFDPKNPTKRVHFAVYMHRAEVTPIEAPAVESVSAITRTGVTLVLPKVTEAIEGFTVEVVDPSGKILDVKPINLEIGDSEVTFEFTAILTEDPASGIWVVGGTEFDQAEVYAVKSVQDALTPVTAVGVNQVDLLAALNSSYFNNVDEDLIAVYTSSLHAAKADLNTVKDVQKVIDDTNKGNVSATEATRVLKEISAAQAKSEVAVYNALTNNFVRVNSDWIKSYTLAGINLSATGSSAVTEYNKIQPSIDTVNNVAVGTAVTSASTSLNATVVANAKNLVETYYNDLTPNNNVDEKATHLKTLAVQSDVIGVRTANTNAKLQNALTKLDATVNDKTRFDVATVNANELSRYRSAVSDSQNTVAAIKSLINTQNGLAEAAVVTEINNITVTSGAGVTPVVYSVSTEEFKTLLEQLADRSKFANPTTPAFKMNVVIDTMLVDYLAALEDDNSASATAVKNAIVTVNAPGASLIALKDATAPADADALLALLKAKQLNFNNVVDANKANYLVDVAGLNTAATLVVADGTLAEQEAAALTRVASVVDAVNAKVELNSATTATAARDALTKLAIADGSLVGYINLSSTVKLEVADLVLAAKPVSGFANVAAVKTVVGSASSGQIKAHADLVAAVNTAYTTDTITAMNNALKGLNYDAYKNLTAVKQLNVAEAFLKAFPKTTNASGVVSKVDYTTLTGIKADIDKAIASVN